MDDRNRMLSLTLILLNRLSRSFGPDFPIMKMLSLRLLAALAIASAALTSCTLPDAEAKTATISQPIGFRNLSPKVWRISGCPAAPVAINGEPMEELRMTSAVLIPAGETVIRCQGFNQTTGAIVAGDVKLQAIAGHQYITYYKQSGLKTRFFIEDKLQQGVPVASGIEGAKPIISTAGQQVMDDITRQIAISTALRMSR
jgi:hypothetical protein